MPSQTRILISGCSGGGKSTLLQALADRGYATIAEPGRRIVAQELQGPGAALPWVDMRAFAERALRMALDDLEEAEAVSGPVFFDRGLVDAAVALDWVGGGSYREMLAGRRPYAKTVFLAPPWPEIFVQDAARKHGFSEAVEEYARLEGAFIALGYDTCTLPRCPVPDRIDFLLQAAGIA